MFHDLGFSWMIWGESEEGRVHLRWTAVRKQWQFYDQVFSINFIYKVGKLDSGKEAAVTLIIWERGMFCFVASSVTLLLSLFIMVSE